MIPVCPAWPRLPDEQRGRRGHQVEDSQQKEEQRDDKLIENAK
jgi:hypothetical protein